MLLITTTRECRAVVWRRTCYTRTFRLFHTVVALVACHIAGDIKTAKMAEACRPKGKVKRKKKAHHDADRLIAQDVPSLPDLDPLDETQQVGGATKSCHDDEIWPATVDDKDAQASADSSSRDVDKAHRLDEEPGRGKRGVSTTDNDRASSFGHAVSLYVEEGTIKQHNKEQLCQEKCDAAAAGTSQRSHGDGSAIRNSCTDEPNVACGADATPDHAVPISGSPTTSQQIEAGEALYHFPTGVSEATAPPLEDDRECYAAVQGKLATKGTDAGCEDKIISHRKKIKRLYPQLKDILDEPAMRPFAEDQILTLYENPILVQRATIATAFVENNAEKQLDTHELYKLLALYMKSRQDLIEARTTVRKLQADIDDLQPGMWDMAPKVATAKGRCADNKTVSIEHPYKQAVFSEDVLSKASQCLQELRELLRDKYSLHVHNSEVLQLKINYYIQSVINVPVFRKIPKNAQASCSVLGVQSTNDRADVDAVKTCVSILFVFARRPVRDKEFLTDIRKWLTVLTSLLLRIASLHDHLFILNHVLRCPPGIHKWAISLVQIPAPHPWSPYTEWPVQPGSPHLDYAVAALASILLPPEGRKTFLQPILSAVEASTPQDRWVILDSDGEENEEQEGFWLNWSENDVVSLLNQIPFSALFRHLLFVTCENGEDIYHISRTASPGLLKVISVASHLLNILHAGLKTFNFSRYRQLTKRISRLIRHAVEYVADHWLIFRSACSENDRALLSRLQVEYDQFFLRAVNCIFYSQLLGAWQFMAILPYESVSDVMMWQLLWLLHNRYQDKVELADLSPGEIYNKIQDRNVRLAFEENLNVMPQSELFFLLTSFANMAASRNSDASLFIHMVAAEMFEITYLNKQLRTVFSKEGRDLLSSLAQKHPFIISILLDRTDDHMMELGNMACYLMQAMPLKLWVPEREDLDIISHFLLYYPLNSAQSQLARLLIQSLNYGFGKADETYLELGTHQQIGLLLLEAYQKLYVPYESSGYVYRQIKNITDFAMATKESSTPAGFVSWMWEILFRLKLHIFDRSPQSMLLFVTEGQAPASIVPSLQECDWLHPLVQGNKGLLPPSLYLSISLSSVGHYREEVVSDGLKLLSTLVLKEQYTAAVQCIRRILPLFYQHPEMISQSSRFLSDLQCLILADNTYLAMAKSLVQSDFPGPILKQLAVVMRGHVLQAQQWPPHFAWFSVKLWLTLLCHLPDIPLNKGALANKVKGCNSVMYLLDILVQLAYLEARCHAEVVASLTDTLTQHAPMTAANSVVKSVFSYVLGTSVAWPTLVPLPSAPDFPWFAWTGMLAEGQLTATADMWRSVLREMAVHPKLTPDAALRKVSAYTKGVPPTADVLLIYRWAHQAVNTALEHPALPLIWQQFFLLYLQRPCVQQSGSVGQRFFETSTQFSLLKMMKRRLNELADHFFKKYSELLQSLKEQSHTYEGKGEEMKLHAMLTDRCLLYQKLMKTYRTLYLWLEEPRLHDRGISLTALPPQYCAELLNVVLQGDRAFWLELVNAEDVQDTLCTLMSDFHVEPAVCKNALRGDLEANFSPEERILKRLKTYEDPLPPPPVPTIRVVIPDVTEDLFRRPSQLMTVLSSELKVLIGHARMCNAQRAKISVLDSQYVNSLPNLYQNVPSQARLMLSCSQQHGCTGPVSVCLRFNQAQKDRSISAAIEQNRAEWVSVLNDVLDAPSPTACCSVLHIEVCLMQLICKHRGETATELTEKLKALGANVFFEVTTALNKETMTYAPACHFLTGCLDIVGQEFISNQPEQCLPVLRIILKDPTIVGHIAPFFTPSSVSIEEYTKMYTTVVSCLSPPFYNAIFVVLTKFDLQNWLRSKHAPAALRKELINAIEKALSTFGMSPEREVVPLLDIYHLHLQSLLMLRFPEHYGSILDVILRGINTCSVPVSSACMFLHALGFILPPNVTSGMELFVSLREFAMRQCLLDMLLLRDTMEAVTLHFSKLRCKDHTASKNGLYSKVQPYLSTLSLFLGMVSHCLIWEAAKCTDHQSPKSVTSVLDYIYKLYAPWLEFGENRKAQLPWLPGELDQAHYMAGAFFASLAFLHETCSGSSGFSVLSDVWQRYFAAYVWNDAPEHVTSLFHSKLRDLPWSHFTPSLKDMRLMCKILETRYMGHMPLLATVFQAVSWVSVLEEVAEAEPAGVVMEYYSCFAEILVKGAWNPQINKAKALPALIHSIVNLKWSLLPAEHVQNLQHTFEHSCDPTHILLPQNGSEHDIALLDFIMCLSCMSPPEAMCTDSMTVQKQRSYIAMLVKLFSRAMEAMSSLLKHHLKEVQQLLPRLIKQCQAVISAELDSQSLQSRVLIAESLALVSMMSNMAIQDALLDGLLQWIASCSCHPIVLSCLFCACRNLASVDHMVAASEACIMAYCSSTSEMLPADGGWTHVAAVFSVPELTLNEFFKACSQQSAHFTQYCYILHRLPRCRCLGDEFALLSQLVEWTGQSYPGNEDSEPKLLLLWEKVFALSIRQLDYGANPQSVYNLLEDFCATLTVLGEDKSGAGLWGAIGLGKKSVLSHRFRYCCRMVCAFVRMQMVEPNLIRLESWRPEDTWKHSAVSLQALAKLKSLQTNKAYASLSCQVEEGIEIVQDRSKSLRDGLSVIRTLVSYFYSDRVYLRILFFGIL